MLSKQIHNFSKEDDKLPGRSTSFFYPTQAARPWGTCNYPLSLFACLKGKLMRFAPSDNLLQIKNADSE